MRDQLEKARKAEGVSASLLARQAGLHQETVYNFRKSKSSPSVDNYQKLVTALGYKVILKKL
jgi:transcriptional regulator with XRE-family HTH domain